MEINNNSNSGTSAIPIENLFYTIQAFSPHLKKIIPELIVLLLYILVYKCKAISTHSIHDKIRNGDKKYKQKI